MENDTVIDSIEHDVELGVEHDDKLDVDSKSEHDSKSDTESSSTETSESSSIVDSSDTSDSDGSGDDGPSKWQHWDRWQGPWYKKDKMNKTIIPRSGTKINLVPSDNTEPIEISKEVITLSSTINNMLQDFTTDVTTPIPLFNVPSETAKKIVEYLEYLYDNPKNEEWDMNEKQSSTDWEEKFILLECEDFDIFNLVKNYQDIKLNLKLYCSKLDSLCLAANFLDIKPLLKLCVNRFAKILEQIPPEHMGPWCQELFGTANDHIEEDYKTMMETHEKYFGDQ